MLPKRRPQTQNPLTQILPTLAVLILLGVIVMAVKVYFSPTAAPREEQVLPDRSEPVEAGLAAARLSFLYCMVQAGEDVPHLQLTSAADGDMESSVARLEASFTEAPGSEEMLGLLVRDNFEKLSKGGSDRCQSIPAEEILHELQLELITSALTLLNLSMPFPDISAANAARDGYTVMLRQLINNEPQTFWNWVLGTPAGNANAPVESLVAANPLALQARSEAEKALGMIRTLAIRLPTESNIWDPRMAAPGYGLLTGPPYRSFTYQDRLFSRKDVSTPAGQMVRMQDSAAPGTSRHHLGVDFDLFAVGKAGEPGPFAGNGPLGPAWSFMDSFAHHFGFVQPYRERTPDNGSGYLEERWHWSYWPVSGAVLIILDENRDEYQRRLEELYRKQGLDYAYPLEHWPEYVFNVGGMDQGKFLPVK
jgi:hypothetical protein